MRSWLAVGILAVIVLSCDSSRPSAAAELTLAAGPSPNVAQAARSLPSPRLKGPASLEEVLAGRRSAREFVADPLADDELGQLLWAAQGVTDAEGRRTTPSAGALYPLELYAVTSMAVFRYDPATHSIATRRTGDHRRDLMAAALGQGSVGEAPVTLVVAADYGRTAVKYGDRAERYVQLEAGHAAQNVLLQAVALGLGAVPIGAFDDERVAAILALPTAVRALYLVPVGHPR